MSAQILIVEDESVIARDIRSTLVDLGYVVPPPVSTGEGALEAITSKRPDLVLMDIRIQGEIDGIEAAARIRESQDTPVVFLTAHADDETVGRAKATGAYGYVVKPFSERDLRSAIEVALQKHELEQHLAKRERFFATTLASIGDAVIATDRDQTITFMNPVAERATGWQASAAAGKRLGEVLRLLDGRTGAAMESPLGRALQEGTTGQLPHEALLLGSGGTRVIENSAAPIVDDGNIVGGVLVFRDVTERRHLEERLTQVEHLAALGTLSAGMAHEINNPLTYVLANASFAAEVVQDVRQRLQLLGGAEADALALRLGGLAEVLDDAKEGSMRVHRIVHDLKKFGRLDAADLAPVDMKVVVETAVRMTDNVVRHHAHIRRDYRTTPLVEANDGQLAQVFINLLMNAAQAIGEGSADTSEIVVATYTDAAGRAVAEVRDSGPGIPEELRRRIFDPFFTTKPVGQGSGLGLSIAHSIMQSLGGEISVESRMGAGSVFRVTLPPSKDKLPTEPPEERTGPVRRGRILVIDDELPLARAFKRVLEEDAHDVSVETDPKQALLRVDAGETFDVVFCDLMMRGMSGMELFEAIRVRAPDVARRMVFVTGGAFTGSAQDFLQTTQNTVLEKPIKPNELRRMVSEFLGRQPS